VPKEDQTANELAGDNFKSFKNVRVIHADGLDVFDSFRAMREAVEYVRTGAGCAIVHAKCVRIHSHSNSDRHELYRSPDELAAALPAHAPRERPPDGRGDRVHRGPEPADLRRRRRPGEDRARAHARIDLRVRGARTLGARTLAGGTAGRDRRSPLGGPGPEPD